MIVIPEALKNHFADALTSWGIAASRHGVNNAWEKTEKHQQINFRLSFASIQVLVCRMNQKNHFHVADGISCWHGFFGSL